MMLSDVVSINGRFLRSVRIDEDHQEDALDGYIFTKSISEILGNFSKQQAETGQGAYTWTGPYGSGKSSLALVLTALLTGSEAERQVAAQKTDPSFAKELLKLLPPKKEGWRCVSVVGRRGDPSEVIGVGLKKAGFTKHAKYSSAEKVIETLKKLSADNDDSSGGLILFIDEMGKFLESAAITHGDAYFFQLLGEAATRSNGRLIVVGILHQSFQEYASKLAREVRDEWGKIQGRFADIPVNISGDEQIELVSKAIVKQELPKIALEDAEIASNLLEQVRPSSRGALISAFSEAWPLNPLVTLLLGPISRRSYGQNQRSIFSFLGSSEQFAFRDYLKNTEATSTERYRLSQFWDYLDFNLQSSIAVSHDNHHFVNARDAISRVQTSGGFELEIEIVKSIALLEITQKQTGLGATKHALSLATNSDLVSIKSATEELERKSIIVFRKFRDVYALFDGSDFDIEAALDVAFREISSVNISSISDALSVSTIFAKRHYHRTGSLRWCELKVLFEGQLEDYIYQFVPSNGAFGAFILALNDGSTESPTSGSISTELDFAIARSEQSQNLVALAREHEALKFILANNPELQRDKIARREVGDRVEALGSLIEREVWLLIDGADWEIDGSRERLNWTGLNALASKLADARFSESPILKNELLNRNKPSGNANAAIKQLLYAAVAKEGEEGLGFQKYPAEKGLFVSLIEANDLYHWDGKAWSFAAPSQPDEAKLLPMWNAAKKFLKRNKDKNIRLTELYDVWRPAPFGVKNGVMPLLAVLFMLAERKNLSHYREGIFLSSITDIDIDYILKSPELVQLRWMDMSNSTKLLLADLANVAGELRGVPVVNLNPLDVGRALIAAFDSAAPWVQRTARLSDHAKKVRALFKRSNDPTKFLFDEIPALYADQFDVTSEQGIGMVSSNVKEGLSEILDAYPILLSSMRDQVLAELQVHSRSKKAFEELNERAKNIRDVSGDLRIKAFINQLVVFDDALESVEALAGLGINKPTKSWIDNDIDKALVQLTLFAQQFNKLEAVARVKGRKDKRSAMALIVNVDGRPAPIVKEFDVLDSDIETVEAIKRLIEDVIKKSSNGASENIILAALAKVGAARIESLDTKETAV